jgi:hypothetical protein
MLKGSARKGVPATATAYLSELDASGRGGTPRHRAEIIATAANLGGIGLGPLVSGFLAGSGAGAAFKAA